MAKEKKVVKPSPVKPTTPTTKESTRATTRKAKEKTKAIDQGGQVQKKQRKKYVAHLDSDEEKTE